MQTPTRTGRSIAASCFSSYCVGPNQRQRKTKCAWARNGSVISLVAELADAPFAASEHSFRQNHKCPHALVVPPSVNIKQQPLTSFLSTANQPRQKSDLAYSINQNQRRVFLSGGWQPWYIHRISPAPHRNKASMPSSSPSSTLAEAGDIPHHHRPPHPSYTADAASAADTAAAVSIPNARFGGDSAMLQAQQRAQGLRPPGHKCVYVCVSDCVSISFVHLRTYHTHPARTQAGADAGGGAVRVAGGGWAGQELGVLAAEVKYIRMCVCVCLFIKR